MKDFVGNELHIGDEVVYACSRGRGIYMGIKKILGFTEKMLKVNPDYTYRNHQYDLAKPENCVLFIKPEGYDAKTKESK